MKISRWTLVLVTMAWVTAPRAFCQNPYDLVFNQPVQATNANNLSLGDYYTGTTFDFLNVVPALEGGTIDMRVTITDITSPRYVFDGTLPDYSQAAGQPGGDLGFLYRYAGGSGAGGDFGEGGVTYQLEFFSGGSNFTDPYAIPDFRLMIYDIDGDPSQGESVTAFTGDGLTSYQLFDSTELSVTTGLDGSHRFSGPLDLLGEDDPGGAVILNYSNTSSIRLRMHANTSSMSQNNNGVFGAIDGDMSLIGSGSFGSPVMVVPEPSAALLGLLGCLPLLRRKRGLPA